MDGLNQSTGDGGGSGGGAPPSAETIAMWVGVGSAGVALGVGLLSALVYLLRICAGKDVVSECIVGRSRVQIAVDADGNGVIETDNKLVVDVAARTAKVVPRSPGHRGDKKPAAGTVKEQDAAKETEGGGGVFR